MLDDRELARVLGTVPADLLLRVRLLMAEWPLEAERLLSEHLGDAQLGKDTAASMIRRMVRS